MPDINGWEFHSEHMKSDRALVRLGHLRREMPNYGVRINLGRSPARIGGTCRWVIEIRKERFE